MRTNEEIINMIKEAQNKKQLSSTELALRTGVAKSTLSRYLNGSREFPLNLADKFADVLGISSAYLLGVKSNDNEVDLADDKTVAFYQGKQVSDEDMEIIKRLLRGK